MDIGGWLRGLGLKRYEQAFRENEIDLRVLPELTADDLKELGVAAIGHRRLLLKAIADLAAGAGRAAAENVPAASPVPAATREAERRQLTVIALNRLGRNEGAMLVHRLAGNLGALPADIVDEIVERTDGVPLFVEGIDRDGGRGRRRSRLCVDIRRAAVVAPRACHLARLAAGAARPARLRRPRLLEARAGYRDKLNCIVSETSMRDAVMLGGKGGSCAPRIISSRPASRSAYPVLL
jgi:SAM domain (Sterile alpha motif)